MNLNTQNNLSESYFRPLGKFVNIRIEDAEHVILHCPTLNDII